ncbi:MAG: pentapeptide repeat-containing protein [Candidatus Omnitrophica bacterium]|nr:pentapeptide repeat-containing protein [Candidatus Omnitrophota bacterium]
MINVQHKCGCGACDELAVVSSEFCWDHVNSKDSYLETLLRAAGENRDLAGCNLKKVSLRGVLFEKFDFSGSDLSQADMTGSHFFDSKLKGAALIGTDLSSCDFTHCDIQDADLTKSKMSGSRLWNSDLSGANMTEADISFADFWNAKLFNIKMWHASLNGVRSVSKSSFSKGKGPLEECRINEDGELSAEESYRDIKQLFASTGRYGDASWASFKEKTMERRILKKKGSLEYLPSLTMNILCGYGEKPYRIILSALSCILGFAFLYRIFGAIECPASPGTQPGWMDYIYYSTITYTTVGYGDFIPKPHSTFRMLAATEAFLGVFLAGLFVFTLARKYSAR